MHAGTAVLRWRGPGLSRLHAQLPETAVQAQVGKSIDRKSRKHEAPQRPKGGYAVLVRPARRGVRYEPFVALPDGSRRVLTEDESLYLGRQVPRARRRIL